MSAHLVPLKEEYSTEEVIEIMFPVVKTDVYDSSPLPEELWVKICQDLELVDLFSLGLVNKGIGSIIRRHELFQDFLSQQSDKITPLYDLLFNTDLNLRWHHNSLLKQKIKKLFILDARAHTRKFCMRAQDAKLILSLYEKYNAEAKDVKLPAALADHLYGDKISSVETNDDDSTFELHYLPPLGAPKLLKVVSLPEIANIMICTTNDQRSMFHACLMAHYIIPLWRGEEVELSAQDFQSLKDILPHLSYTFRRNFTDLFWACYLITGTMRKTEKHVIGPICRFLEGLGFKWDSLVQKKAFNECNLENQAGFMVSIYSAALFWGLDIRKIAEKTPDHELSKEILEGRLPEILRERSVLTADNCLMHKHNGMKKMFILNGKSYPMGSTKLEKKLKRKMEENGFEERPMKRHRGELLATPENTAMNFNYFNQIPSVGKYAGLYDTLVTSSLNLQVIPAEIGETANWQSGQILLLNSLLSIRGNIQAQIDDLSAKLGLS